jgi:hypothetical protein
MLIQLSGIGITDASGKLGGTVFSKNGGGKYCRVKSKPLNGQTIAQTGVRSNLTSLAQGWALLTAAQILAWNTFGQNAIKTNKIGNKSAQSGFNAYVEFNQRILNAGGTVISVPPALVTVAPLSALSLTAVHAGATTMTFAASPVPTGLAIKVQTTGNLSAGKSFVKNHFRTIEYVAAAATTPAILTTAQNAKWGAPTVGSVIWVRASVISIATGYESLAIQAKAVVS